MASMYPERPVYSPWSDIGSALTQGAGMVRQYDDNRNAMQEIVARRAGMAMERQRQAREEAAKAAQRMAMAAEAEKAQQSMAARSASLEQFQTFTQGEKPESPIPFMAPGLGQNGGPVPSIRPSRQQMQDKALELGVYGDAGVKAYMDDTKPAAGLTLEDRLALEQAKAGLKPPPSAGPRDRFSLQIINGRKIKVNLDTDEQTDIGPATVGAEKDLSASEIEKLSELGDKKNQVDTMVNTFSDDFAGFGNGAQNTIGKYTGTNKDQVIWWQNYATFVNKVRNDLFGAALTPGEKAEFEKTTITTGTAPAIVRVNLAEQARIVKGAVERRKGVYTAGRRVNQDQVNAAFGDPGTVKKTADDYLKDAGL